MGFDPQRIFPSSFVEELVGVPIARLRRLRSRWTLRSHEMYGNVSSRIFKPAGRSHEPCFTTSVADRPRDAT